MDVVEDLLEIEIDQDDRTSIEIFWQKALNPTHPRIVWLSQWSTMEYCGFLEWLRRNGDAAFNLVNLTDHSLPDPRTPGITSPVQCVSLVRGELFAKYALWDRAITPDRQSLSNWASLWEQLRTENAPLRVMTPEGLVSAQIDYFDKQLLKHATNDWAFDRSLVGQVLGDMMVESFRERGVFQCGDLVLFARVHALVERGALEGLGDPYARDFKVRLPVLHPAMRGESGQ
ncbi:DUF3658 domain-containing protein [Brevundimonas subvibrioides]|uniref:DUF3658 domain-containing protein n=1 Tax=Brevundimonas subvibrioides TaxID=74313 RepID=UPI0032D59971